MNIYFSSASLKDYRKITRKDHKIKKKIKEKLELFKEDPVYPSLKLHKLQGEYANNWSITVEDNLKIIFTYTTDGIMIVDIGTHDEVY